MTMPPYQPSDDSVLVNPIAPFGSPELGALVTTLSAHLRNPEYQIDFGGPVRVQGTAWAPADAARSPATRRALYDAAERAVAAAEGLGWAHTAQPEITLAERELMFGRRIGAHVLLTLHRPHHTGKATTR
ncbi:hypothetical protein GCM10017673_38890 [Streptosporangium violaceochromogenes]|nr:hypothetical protein GCM10017673_38890 [Streptosporangium violaceochromogenes]